MSKRIDTIMKEFIGRRFSTFTVDSLCEEKNKWREYMWNCVCDCVYVKQLPSSYIKKGFTVDCPVCGTKSSAYKQDVLLNKKSNFIDKRFGEWTVIGLGDTLSSKSGRFYQSWTCRCSCGTIKDVNEYSLSSGRSTSCGCKRIESVKAVVRDCDDLTGRVFTNLTVVERLPDKVYPCSGSSQMYKCSCVCGKESIVARSMLVSGQTRSCGCLYMPQLEQDCISFFNEHGIEFVKNKTFFNLLGVNGKNLSYDFYVVYNKHEFLIECQGEQHYRPVEHFGGEKRFLIQQEHDKRKRDFALNYGFDFLELPYNMNKDDIFDFLSKNLLNVSDEE